MGSWPGMTEGEQVKSLRTSPEQLRYRVLIGVGGIGSGTFFEVRGNRTFGREESRLGRFLDRRDYCKLHIIAHYVGTLLGPGFLTLPVGAVGEDAAGRQLLEEMAAAGLDTRFVKIAAGHPTLHSFCVVYPDGSGGNLTTEDSACSTTTSSDLAALRSEFRRFRSTGVALAAPEVPLPVRAELLDQGQEHGFFNVAAFSSEEILPAFEEGMVKKLGLLAMNRHEAAALVQRSAEGCRAETIVESAVSFLAGRCPGVLLSITAGADGSWTWDGERLDYRPIPQVHAQGTAGAGDAHLAGLIAGMAAGLGFAQAHELAGLVSSFSVTSPHTIHPGVTRQALFEFAIRARIELSPATRELLEGEP